MAPKAAAKAPVEPELPPEPEKLDPNTGRDFFRYQDTPNVTYEGTYDTHPKPPEKPAEEAPPPAKGAKAAPPPMELEEPAEPPSRVRQGPGVYSDGAIYFKGEFEVDGVDRQGLLKCASGASYEGGFDKGIYHGQGKYTWPDGSRYEGGWRQGVMHGTGTYHCTQRDETFHGQYYNGAGPGFFGQR